MRKIMSFGLVFSLLLGSGCREINWNDPDVQEAIPNAVTALPSPGNIKIENGVLSWNRVDGASGYLLYLGDTKVYVEGDTTEYTIPSLSSGASINIAIQAVGNGVDTKNSSVGFYLTYSTDMPFIEQSGNTEAPDPLLPIPTEAQLKWQKLEQYAFIHFGPNTFRNAEWGEGKPTEGQKFQPTSDVETMTTQWADELHARGMKALILTVKHHDGFCLWDTAATDYSVSKTGMYNGNITGALAPKLQAHGMKLGLYLSPWDRNNWAYLHPEYVEIFTKQTEEITTQFGEIFEVWFDGANEATGWYGGATYENHIAAGLGNSPFIWFQQCQNQNPAQMQTRNQGQLVKNGPTVGREDYLKEMKNKAIEIIRKNQPDAVVFGDNSGKGIRWVGNEQGWAGRTCWSMGTGTSGSENGATWFPAEADMKTRSGWFHSTNSSTTRPYRELLEFWYRTVGRNATLLLNFSPGRDGLIPADSLEEARKMWKQVSEDFKTNLAVKENIASIVASNIRGSLETFGPYQMIDGDFDTYWTVNNDITSGSVTFNFKNDITFDRILLQEYIALGQRVKSFTVEVKDSTGAWVPVELPAMPYPIGGDSEDPDTTTTIGYKRILRTAPTTTDAFRLTINESRAPVPFLISEFGLYKSYEGSLEE